VVWDRATGNAVHRAIVWQTAAPRYLRPPEGRGHEPRYPRKPADHRSLFLRHQVAWILDSPGARARAERGELMFGTVDCYLLWRLTGGKVHATDATNASRTLLFNIHLGEWTTSS